ncbi:MAG: beta-ketoacyl synthase N-terminal-like domain-containing protein, partial [Anaerolineales bacterium]
IADAIGATGPVLALDAACASSLYALEIACRKLAAGQIDIAAVAAVNAQVEGRRVIIYDDMIRTGSSLLGAARAYLGAGASSLAVVATHGVFPGDAFAAIQASGLFTDIACTDSHF